MKNLIEGIEAMTAERDSVKEAAEENIPPVLPHDLFKLHGAKFAAIIRKQQDRWEELVLAVEANKIDQDFQLMKLAYQTEESLKKLLDQCDLKVTFCKGWNIIQACFKQLENFCNRLVTIFTGTANVESNFLIRKWKKKMEGLHSPTFCWRVLFMQNSTNKGASLLLVRINTIMILILSY